MRIISMTLILLVISIFSINAQTVNSMTGSFSPSTVVSCGAVGVQYNFTASGNNLSGSFGATFTLNYSNGTSYTSPNVACQSTSTAIYGGYISPFYTSNSATMTVKIYKWNPSYGTWDFVNTFTSGNANVTVNNAPNLNSININNIPTSTSGLPATIYRCSSGSSLILNTNNSTSTSYSYIIEKGYLGANNTFMNLPNNSSTNLNLYTSTTIAGNIPSTINLVAVAPKLLLSEYAGLIRVTLNANNICGATNKTVIYNLDGNIEFNQISQNCANGTPMPRYTDVNFTFNNLGVITNGTPPCMQGWMGANSCGITGVTGQSSTSSQIIVDRVQVVGNVVSVVPGFGNIVNRTLSFIPSSFNFNANINTPTFAAGFFNTNYLIIKNNWLFRITLNSAGCSSIGYFKIIDGGPNDGKWFRTANPNSSHDADFKLYPNPTNTDYINVEWQNVNSVEKSTSISIFDITGKQIINENVIERTGLNIHKIDLSVFKTGTYLYKIVTENETFTGKFIKE